MLMNATNTLTARYTHGGESASMRYFNEFGTILGVHFAEQLSRRIKDKKSEPALERTFVKDISYPDLSSFA